MSREQRHRQVKFGQTVYDEDGNELGRVQRFDEGGFYVSYQRLKPLACRWTPVLPTHTGRTPRQ